MGKTKKKISEVDATPTPRDREIQKYLLAPIGRHRGLFAEWESIPWLSDIIRQKEKELYEKYSKYLQLQPHEIRALQREVKQYKENGILYREIEDGFAIGFGFRTYIDFHKNGKKHKPESTPLFDEVEERKLTETLSEELIKKIKGLRLYHQGKDIIEYILSSAHHQKRYDEIVIKQKEFAELLDPHQNNPNIGQDIREIIDSLSWIYYKIKDKTGDIVAFGSFIYDLRYEKKKKQFIISINPRFLGCTHAALTGDKEDRTKSERKKLFGSGEGYFQASIRKIFLCNAREFTSTQRQLIDHILLNRGEEVNYQGKKYKLLKFRVSPLVLDTNAPIKYSGDSSTKLRKFITDLRIALIEGTEGYTIVVPSIKKLESLRPSEVSQILLKCYIPINLEEIWEEALEEETNLIILNHTDDEKIGSGKYQMLAQRILTARRNRKMTQQQLAKVLGVSRRFVSYIERGEKAIPPSLEKKLLEWVGE